MDLAGLVRDAGLEGSPLAVAALGPDGLAEHAEGCWRGGQPVTTTDRLYGASLAKQITGTAIAVLVQSGTLDPEVPVGRCLRDLPGWRDTFTVRQLLHHAAGLPEAGALEQRLADAHWSSARVLTALCSIDILPFPPGSAYRYSNAGYILLAALIEAISGLSFADFVTAKIFSPLGLDGMTIRQDGEAPPYPQVAELGTSLPLSTGDGGLWTTAAAFARWLDTQNRDVLGVADLVQQPGRLADGTQVDYGWGIGLRHFRGHRLFIHGGGWQGAAAKAVRCPALGLGVVGLSSGHADGINVLVDAVLNTLADQSSASSAVR